MWFFFFSLYVLEIDFLMFSSVFTLKVRLTYHLGSFKCNATLGLLRLSPINLCVCVVLRDSQNELERVPSVWDISE